MWAICGGDGDGDGDGDEGRSLLLIMEWRRQQWWRQ